MPERAESSQPQGDGTNPAASTIQLRAGSVSPPASWLPGTQQTLLALDEFEFVELRSHTNPHNPAASS